MIVISADGMCEVGRIQHHLIHNISNAQNTILIVGYMAEGTLGRRIMDGAKEVRIHGDFYKVAANVKIIDAFSAHADWQETLAWLSETETQNLKSTLLVHGESKALESMKNKLLEVGLSAVEIAKLGQRYALA
jgi:metallo-beta-lactamase family protein